MSNKKKKKRANKYEKKLAIESTLDEVLKVSVPEEKKEKKRKSTFWEKYENSVGMNG